MLGSRHRRSTRPLAAVLALVLSAGVVVGLAAPAQAHDGGHALIFTKTTAFRHTDAIAKGTPLITAALRAENFEVVHTENSAIFNDAELAAFDVIIMFQTSGDPWTADQKAALERYQRAGGGIVAIHNATDMRGNYAWWDNLVGALMPGHADTGTDPGQRGTVRIEDPSHPSTEHFNGSRWQRSDEWYNYSKNVRGTAHILASMDETTYAPGGNAMGYDHPISWCKPYDGGRAWVTGMGHFGSHYAEPALMSHIVGGVKYAAGLEAGDCGGTVWDSFEKVALDQNTSAPFAMDVAPDGRVFYTELVRGQVRVWDPKTKNVTTALELDVYSGGEDGLLGIALDPAFATNGRRLPLPLARRREQLQPVELLQPGLPVHDAERRDRPGVRGAHPRGPGTAPARRARPHRRRPRLRRRRQPVPGRRRRRQPALGALGRLRAAVEPVRHVPRRPRDVREHERPARQAPAHQAQPHRARIHHPLRQPVPRGERHREQDPSRDLRDGLPQPVPVLRRPEDRRHQPRRLLTRQRDRRTVDERPCRHLGVELHHVTGQLRLAAVHGQQRAVPQRRLQDEPGHGRRQLQLRQPGQRLAAQHRPHPAAPRPGGGHVVRVQALVRAGRDPPGRQPGTDGRPGLQLRPPALLRHEVPGVVRRQAVLLRVGPEQDVLHPAEGPRRGFGLPGGEGHALPAPGAVPGTDRLEVRT